jgi:anti-anti-sigma factor
MRVSLSEQGDIYFLQIEGRLEIEKIKQLTTELQTKFQNKNIVFCLEKLSFVGSCGIQKFFSDLEELQKNKVINASVKGLNRDFRLALSQRVNLFTELNIEPL